MALNRIRIGKQTELSATPGSIVITSGANEQQYLAPGANGTVLQVTAGVPTWNAAGGSSFTITDGTTSQVINAGDTLLVTPGNGIEVAVIATDSLTIAALLSTDAGNAVTFGSDTGLYVPQAQLLTNATWSDATNTITLTFADATTIDIPIVDVVSSFLFDMTVAGTTGTDLINNHETLTVVGGTGSGITTAVTANTITINRLEVEETFTALTTGSTVTLAFTPLASTVVNVYRNGIRQLAGSGNDYTIATNVVTFTTAFALSTGAAGAGEQVQVVYVH